ncbi:MAG: ATP phosphoribosyltransferase regulatory subunit [Rhodopseudomonas palustris]|nr:ATP phosphoribosyltransferase regulatory subunit [Rhodopseudomonas palustris]
MYTFTDKGGERITLRPEATPSLVRAFVEHSLEQPMAGAEASTTASGPMFRYERPQKGRYRQFHQVDVEVFGVSDPAIDAEVHRPGLARCSQELGIADVETRGQLGRLPGVPARVRRGAAQGARRGRRHSSAATASGGPSTNPLRIFDCKVAARTRPSSTALPHSVDYLCDAVPRRTSPRCERHLDALRASRTASIHRLVRGLDYYTRTTFEILAGNIGAQNAILGGGRYDGLVKRARRARPRAASASPRASSASCWPMPGEARGQAAARRSSWRRLGEAARDGRRSRCCAICGAAGARGLHRVRGPQHEVADEAGRPA